MGGTFLEKGNVEEPEHDGTAEWNAFWDPEAVKTIFDTSIKIEMVALESTNQAIIDTSYFCGQNQRQFIGVDFLGQQVMQLYLLLLILSPTLLTFLWDVLTTAQIKRKLNRFYRTLYVQKDQPSDAHMRAMMDVHVVNHVNHDEFFNYIIALSSSLTLNVNFYIK